MQEVSTDTLFTSFTFTLPRSATPSFCTQVVGLKWVLRFEFLVGQPGAAPWAKLEELHWALPVLVQAPQPLPPLEASPFV